MRGRGWSPGARHPPPEPPRRLVVRDRRGHLPNIAQGWPKLRDLAQHFDWRSLFEP
jgi:hypothetical protein